MKYCERQNIRKKKLERARGSPDTEVTSSTHFCFSLLFLSDTQMTFQMLYFWVFLCFVGFYLNVPWQVIVTEEEIDEEIAKDVKKDKAEDYRKLKYYQVAESFKH